MYQKVSWYANMSLEYLHDIQVTVKACDLMLILCVSPPSLLALKSGSALGVLE